MAEDGHHTDADGDADAGQRTTQPDRRAHLGPAGGDAALGEDQRERAEAEGVCQRGVVERDAQTRLAQGDAHQQVDEKAGQTGPDREPNGEDGSEQDACPDEEVVVELLYRHTCPSASSGDGAV
jgi:hypothetical protein